MKRLIFLLLLIFFLDSCDKTKKTDMLSLFDNVTTKYLERESINLLNDTILWRPINIHVIDTLAIIGDYAVSSCFTILDLKRGKLIKRFGFPGRGPGEMDISAVHFRRTGEKNIFILYEVNAPNRFFKYFLDSLLGEDIYKPPAFVNLSRTYLNDASLLNDSIIVGAYVGSDNALFGLVNINDMKLHKQCKLPLPINDKKNRINNKSLFWLLSVLNGKTLLNYENNKVCYCSYKGLIINISEIDTNDYTLKSIYCQSDYLPEYKVVGKGKLEYAVLTKGCRMGILDYAVTKKRIYMLYGGGEIQKDTDKYLFSDIILVFDWNGNPLEKLVLNKYYTNISVDLFSPDYLYGLHAFDDTVFVDKYKIND